MNYEDYATNDTSRGGACLTPADLEEQAERDDLIESLTTVRNRALHIIRKAARWQGEEHGFLGRELRDRGILP